MTTSNALTGVDNNLDDALKHYGVKGMKWGKRKSDKDEEYKPTPTAGGGGAVDDHEADLREFQELTEYMGTIFRPDAGPIDYDKFNAAIRRLNEIEARIAARNEALEKHQQEQGLPRVRDNRPAASRVPTPSKIQGDTFKSDITTAELLERRKKRQRNAARHDELSDLDDYLMHYGVLGMKWGVRKDRNKTGGTRSKKKTSSSGSSGNQGSGESPKSGSSSGDTKSSKNLTTDQKLARLDKLSEEKDEILNYTDAVKKAAKEVTDSSGETWDGPLKTILEFHPKGVDIADDTADKMGFYDGSISDKEVNKLLKKYRKREFRHDEIDSELDDYLMHYGVKGMKWGVRKDGKPQGYQGGGGSKSKSKKKKSKPKSDTVNRIKSNLKKTAGKITDAREDRKKAKPKPKPKAKRELDVEKAEIEAHAIDARRDSSPSLFSPDTTKTMLTDRTRTGGMTDAELKATIQRMHLETAYAKLVRENTPKSTSQKLMAFAKETATDIAKQQVKRVAGEYAGNLVNKAIGKGLVDAKDQKKKDDPKPKADAPRSESKPKPKAEAPKPSPTTSPASEPKRPAPAWRPTPPGPGRPPNKPPDSEPTRPAPTWRPTGSPRTTPNTSNYVFGDRGRNYEGTRRAQDLIDNHATVTVAELMERRKRRERR